MDLREAVEIYKTDCDDKKCEECPLGKVISHGPKESLPLDPPRRICELFDFINQNLVKGRVSMSVCLHLHWDKLDTLTREEILFGACLQERLRHYHWEEFQDWQKTIIIDNLLSRSKGTVTIEE